MAEIGDIKYIPPTLPSRPARPTEKSGDQGRQKQQHQPTTTHRDDDKQDKDNPGHIDEYV